MIHALLLTALLPSFSNAADPNFLTPADLPRQASQVFSRMGRGELPEFDREAAIAAALKANYARRACKAPIGRQLTPWKETTEQNHFWRYEIAAEFECLPPVERTELTGEAAAQLRAALRGVSAPNGNREALVLCYERLEQVCEGKLLLRYHERETCELQDLHGHGGGVLDDLRDGATVLRDEGALALRRLLPVFTDGRRDDVPHGNCEEHEYRTLKGISRKSARVSCTAEACTVNGIIEAP